MSTLGEVWRWLEREGLESIVRVPHDGRSYWANQWTPGKVYCTMLESAIAGMIEAEKQDDSVFVGNDEN